MPTSLKSGKLKRLTALPMYFSVEVNGLKTLLLPRRNRHKKSSRRACNKACWEITFFSFFRP